MNCGQLTARFEVNLEKYAESMYRKRKLFEDLDQNVSVREAAP